MIANREAMDLPTKIAFDLLERVDATEKVRCSNCGWWIVLKKSRRIDNTVRCNFCSSFQTNPYAGTGGTSAFPVRPLHEPEPLRAPAQEVFDETVQVFWAKCPSSGRVHEIAVYDGRVPLEQRACVCDEMRHGVPWLLKLPTTEEKIAPEIVSKYAARRMR